MTRRLLVDWRLKSGLTVAVSAWFCACYFWLERHPFIAPFSMPLTPLDRAVPFHEWAVWPYVSLYLLTPIGPWLATERAELARYAKGMVGLSAAAFLVFIVFPTAIVRPDPAGHGAVYRLLVTADTTLNAFPSLHAALAVYSALCCGPAVSASSRPGLWRTLLLLWVLAIVYATLATKQHVAADAVSGALLGFAGFAWAYKGLPRRPAADGMTHAEARDDERLQVA